MCCPARSLQLAASVYATNFQAPAATNGCSPLCRLIQVIRSWHIGWTQSQPGMDAGGNRCWVAEKRQAAAFDHRDCPAHRRAGLAAVTGEHYEGGHWLGSFAVYLVTKRGVTTAP